MNPTPAWSALLLLAWGLTTAAADCGVPTQVKGSDGAVLNGRLFPDGSVAVRAPLAVNPDGGPASYTVGDHGFTYLANGIARWRNGARAKCDAACRQDFLAAERVGFIAGTAEFCVFAMEVETLSADHKPVRCDGGIVAGNGQGRPVHGALLDTLVGGQVQTYRSTTSLRHLVDGKKVYLDAERLPVTVSPRADWLGRLVWVGGPGLQPTWAMVGDTGPAFGEGSIALHQLLRTGRVTPQKPGPIPIEKRCQAGELALAEPFLSRPNGSDADRCKPGRVTTTASDVRAYAGLAGRQDFVVLGRGRYTPSSGLIGEEVSVAGLQARAAAASYTQDSVAAMLACLR